MYQELKRIRFYLDKIASKLLIAQPCTCNLESVSMGPPSHIYCICPKYYCPFLLYMDFSQNIHFVDPALSMDDLYLTDRYHRHVMLKNWKLTTGKGIVIVIEKVIDYIFYSLDYGQIGHHDPPPPDLPFCL